MADLIRRITSDSSAFRSIRCVKTIHTAAMAANLVRSDEMTIDATGTQAGLTNANRMSERGILYMMFVIEDPAKVRTCGEILARAIENLWPRFPSLYRAETGIITRTNRDLRRHARSRRGETNDQVRRHGRTHCLHVHEEHVKPTNRLGLIWALERQASWKEDMDPRVDLGLRV